MASVDELVGLHADPLYLTALASLGGGTPSVAPKLPSHGSIAVLPFSNLSGEQEQEYFVDGLTEDIITDLSNEPGLFVIARNTSLSYKGKATDVRRIAFDLGVQHILEGSVRKSAQRLRINVQLSNALEGRQLWAERFDRDIADIFALQDEVTRKIVTSISGKLNTPDPDGRYRPKELDAYDLFLRGRNLGGVSKSECERGRALMEEVLRLDPDYAAAHAELGLQKVTAWMLWNEPEQPNLLLGDYHTKRAVELAPRDSRVLFSRGWVAVATRNYAEAKIHFGNSLAINPNDADAWMGTADLQFLTGDSNAAVVSCASALRLNPHPPAWYFLIAGSALVGTARYEEAVELLMPVVDQHGSSRRFLAVALAKLHRIEEAHEQANVFVQAFPQWRANGHTARRAFKHEKDRDWWRKAYIEAGLPE
jgi:adenylate cyclase